MLSIGLWLLFWLGAIGLILLTSSLFLLWGRQSVHKQINEKMEAMQSIVEEGQIPPAWLAEYKPKIINLRAQGNNDSKLNALGQKAKKHCLARISDLIRFFERDPLMQRFESREHILDVLYLSREEWTQADWEELLRI